MAAVGAQLSFETRPDLKVDTRPCIIRPASQYWLTTPYLIRTAYSPLSTASIVMSVRTFTVFQDIPSPDTAKPRVAAYPETPSSSAIPPATSLASLTEKENVHPLTGGRSGPNLSKKRKTAILATKIHMPLTTKKQPDEPANSAPGSKKRKSASSSVLKVKSASVKKDGKVSGSGRKVKRSTRKISPLPKVEEEIAAEGDRATQAYVDSKCYELTVQPLADVTPAYEQSIPSEDNVFSEKAKPRSAKVR